MKEKSLGNRKVKRCRALKTIYSSIIRVFIITFSFVQAASAISLKPDSVMVGGGTQSEFTSQIIVIGSGIVCNGEVTSIKISFPLGITLEEPIEISLHIEADYGAHIYKFPSSVIIPAHTNFAHFDIVASSTSNQPANLVIKGHHKDHTVRDGLITVFGQKIEFPAGISDNGDGINDFFVIKNIEQYPDNEVMIVNGKGFLYHAKRYNNSDIVFSGNANQNVPPKGVYYYNVKINDNGQEYVYKGSFLLKR